MSDEVKAALEKVRIVRPNCPCASCVLAQAFVDEHPADEDEPVTEEWLRECGGIYVEGVNPEHAGGYVFSITEADLSDDGESGYFGEEMRLIFSGDTWSVELRNRRQDWCDSVGVNEVATRGQFRALCAALGIELKS